MGSFCLRDKPIKYNQKMLIIRSFSYALQSLNTNIYLKKLIVQNGILNEGLVSDDSIRN